MEPIKVESAKFQDMIMCGDHPSVTKAELNIKESVTDAFKDKKEKERRSLFYNRITPTPSRAVVSADARQIRAVSEHGLLARTPAVRTQQAHVLHAAAVDSFRWPPYLLVSWALLLVVAHALHGLLDLLDRALPTLRRVCEYFSTWTESAWRESDRQLARPAALACASAALWTTYGLLALARALALWAVQPLTEDPQEERTDDDLTKR